jgi:hypothetical protein
VLGIVDPPLILSWRRGGKPRQATLGTLLTGTTVTVAYPDEYLAELIDRMMQMNAAHLPVISRSDATLVGYLSWRDLFGARSKLQQAERQRLVFYHLGQGRRRTRVLAPPPGPATREP